MGTFRRWLAVFIYTTGIFVVTPLLPDLIRAASSRWSSRGVSHFVLNVELFLAALVLVFSISLFFFRKNKSFLLFLSLSGIFFLSFFIYQHLPNPYEFTHLPEYAILSVLVIRALDRKKSKMSRITRNSYLFSGFIAALIGTADEIYQYFLPNRFFTWYDVFLNSLGGILGLLVFWGAKGRSQAAE